MDNLSIFDFEEDKVVKNTINVVNTTFNEVVDTSWEDLFEGYTKLYAITYSSGINFLSKLENNIFIVPLDERIIKGNNNTIKPLNILDFRINTLPNKKTTTFENALNGAGINKLLIIIYKLMHVT